MPSTWTAYSKKKSTCQADLIEKYSCGNEKSDIDEGTVIVRVRQGTRTVDYHPNCWLDTAISIMLEVPYQSEVKGRRRLPITDEEAKERRRLSSQYSAFQTRINNYSRRIMDEDSNSNDLKIAVDILRLKQDRLWYAMKPLGGAPDRWRVPDGQSNSKVQKESDEGSPLDVGAA